MGSRFYERITYIALTIAVFVIFLLYRADKVSEWKVAVCSMSAAVLSISQTYFEFYQRLRVNVSDRPSKSAQRTLRVLKLSGIILHIAGFVFFAVGLAIDGASVDTKGVNVITLFSFFWIILSMTVKSFEKSPGDRPIDFRDYKSENKGDAL